MLLSRLMFQLVAAHPRSRGEHYCCSVGVSSVCGSSPLARGTSHFMLIIRTIFRLIPARAGNIATNYVTLAVETAHPRSRGEHEKTTASRLWQSGSSPLARGTSKVRLPQAPFTRLIPARAGNISGGSRARWAVSAHPRSRGEHAVMRTSPWQTRGSSPLARGTSILRACMVPLSRLIPARAGNMKQNLLARRKQAAHPRSRGEHIILDIQSAGAHGSSPLARGTCCKVSGGSFVFRLIPARAGNIGGVFASPRAMPAHPRSRGEHPSRSSRSLSVSGSSPLARGTCPSPLLCHVGRRLIPARAGNILDRLSSSPAREAHPRSRGEH